MLFYKTSAFFFLLPWCCDFICPHPYPQLLNLRVPRTASFSHTIPS
jgi:hypothetical protein